MRQHRGKRKFLESKVKELAADGVPITEISRQLGIHRVTIWRWLRGAPEPEPIEQPDTEGPEHHQDAGSFREWVLHQYQLSPAEHELLNLACGALALANDPQVTASTRIAAMGRFQALLKDLNLPEPDGMEEN